MIYYKHTAIVHLCTANTFTTVGSDTPLESKRLSLFVVHDTQLTSGTFPSFLIEIKSGIVSMFNKFFACEFSETDASYLRNASPGMFTDRIQTVDRMTRRLSVTTKNQG